ncbi:MAG: hypothetical protein EBT63_01130 [Proteobacteria bacterium]|nr:hypothetical protein [Pseudomonadota bacterium]NCA27836.1 hypothetical protein [Pseudomonadota bacterium]
MNLKIFHNTKLLVTFITILLSFSCRMPDNFGFYQPITMDLRVPDGPPEFKAGWHAGCKSALANRNFANSFVYQENYGSHFGTGVYQHDTAFQTGWRMAFFSCVAHTSTFVSFNSMQHGPLSK